MTKLKFIAIILLSTLILGGLGTGITLIFDLHNGDMVLFTIISFLPLAILACISSYCYKRVIQGKEIVCVLGRVCGVAVKEEENG